MRKLTFAVVGIFICAVALAAVGPDGGEWQDNQRLSLGKEDVRAAFASFDTVEQALAILPEASPNQMSLDSNTAWRFHWSKDPSSRPVDFWKTSYDVSAWPVIKVPCSWQAMGANGSGGWGTALYTNVQYPFRKDVPGGSQVMLEPPKHFTNYAARNPVGSYRRDFSMPEGWRNDGSQRYFLKFDGVDSFYYLWVNGRYVGFAKDSRTAAEFDVTALLVPGKNTVALEVYRYSDGSYFEDQDMFRLSGIFRHTWLVKRPTERIRDFFVTARPVRDGEFAGPWVVTVKADGVGRRRIDTFLYSWDGKLVARDDGKGMFVVDSPKLWSAEEPNCYKVVLSNGREFVSTVFGFRVSEIRNGRYCLNGQKIKIKGANRHETHPMYGHYVPRETHELDVRELKAANCNAVRNSHYPQDDYWYYLCDTEGIYLCDEANVESHGYGYGKDSLSHQKSWEKTTVDRNRSMFMRNKNHPSVIIWSYGNEAGPGENFQAVQKFFDVHDRTRVTHYERDWSVADMTANQYPSVGWMWHKAADSAATKPHYTSEYAHNMVNAMGNLKDYQDAIESSDVILGATIWDWVDQGLYLQKNGRRIIAYGGDFGDQPNDGQFVMNGCVLSDRTREPGFYEIRHVYQNWSAKATDDFSRIAIRNKNYFVDASGVTCRWTAYREGRHIADGTFSLFGGRRGDEPLKPMTEKTFELPPVIHSLVSRGGDVSLRVRFFKTGESGDQIEIAADQIDFPRRRAAAKLPDADGTVRMDEDDKSYRFVTDGGLDCAFCKKTGMPYSIRTGRWFGKEWLKSPMKPDLFRSPSSNEVRPAEQWMAAGFHDLTCVEAKFSQFTNAENFAAFTVVSRWRGSRSVMLRNFGKSDTTMTDKGEVAGDESLVVAQRWTIRADGAVACQSELRWDGKAADFARIGYRMTLAPENPLVEYFAHGPEENYRDRMSGAFLGRYGAYANDFYFPYARNENCGNHEGARSVSFDAGFDHLSFATCGEPFAFEVNPYSQLELIEYNHPPELPPPVKTEFGIYAETRGLGGASCGPDTLERDKVKGDRAYALSFVIRPEKAEGAVGVEAANLPKIEMRSSAALVKVVACTSREPGEGEGEHAVDGNPRTIWHSQYGTTMGMYPHSLTVDLGRPVTAKGMRFLQRNDGSTNGRVKGFQLEVSADGRRWTRELEGELRDAADWQRVDFKSPVTMRYWRFTATSGHYKTDFASMAEIEVVR